jgi:hypothetical protein
MARTGRDHEAGGISFVVTSRNDDHGGNLLARTRLCLGSLLDQARRHGLRGELVLVEWNPPPDRPRLLEALDLRFDNPDFPVRVIEVPRTVHARLPLAEVLPLFQMIAKNVGIRRARCEFVLATNPDLLFSEQLIAFLAKERLDPGRLYRIDRRDVSRDIPFGLDVKGTLGWCRKHTVRVHGLRGSRDVVPLEVRLLKLRGLMRGGSLAGLLRPIAAALRAFVQWTDRRRRGLPVLAAKVTEVLLGLRPPPVHTNACGDFTLMAREQWLAARAYAEFPLYSMHIDSLLVFSAIGLGLEPVILRSPMRLYHIDHGKSWSATRLDEQFRDFVRHPWIDYGLVHAVRQYCFFERKPILFNEADWGFADEELPDRAYASWPPVREPELVAVGR